MKIAVIPGDGIGPDLITQTEKLIDTINTRYHTGIDISTFPYSADYYLKSNISIPDEFIDEVSQTFDAILLGPLGDPRIADMKHAREIIFKLRNRLALSLSLQPVRLFQSWQSIIKDLEGKTVDFIIMKEIFEGTVSQTEQVFHKGRESAIILQSTIITNKNIRTFLQNSFAYMQKNSRQKACCVMQGPKFRESQTIWKRSVDDIKDKYPDIRISYKYIGSAIQELMKDPDEFDVFLTTAETGDMLSAISSVAMGGYGLAYTIELNPELISIYRIMQASSTKLAGSNTINPFGAFLALGQILIDNGHAEESSIINKALMSNFSNHWVTIDMGGIMGTAEVTDYICDFIRNQ